MKNFIVRLCYSAALCACILPLALDLGCGAPQPQKKKPKVIAIIGGREITANMLETYFYENLNGIFTLSFFKDFEQDERDMNRVKSRLFEDFLDAQLLLTEAIKEGITVSDQEVQEFLKEFGEHAAERENARRGGSDLIKEFLIIQKFKNETLFPHVSVSESELKQYYDAKAKEMQSSQRVTLSIIQVATEQEARDILKRIKKGKERFESHAEQYAAESKRREPQTYDMTDLPENIRTEVKRLKPGQLSAVVPLLERFCIFRIERIEKEGMKPFGEVAGSLKERLLREKLRMIFEQYMRDLKSRVEIKIFYESLPFQFVQGDA